MGHVPAITSEPRFAFGDAKLTWYTILIHGDRQGAVVACSTCKAEFSYPKHDVLRSAFADQLGKGGNRRRSAAENASPRCLYSRSVLMVTAIIPRLAMCWV